MRPKGTNDFIHYKHGEEIIRKYIEEYFEKLDKWFWFHISSYQDVSEEFLIEFIENIDTYRLRHNEYIPEDVKERIINLKKVIDQ